MQSLPPGRYRLAVYRTGFQANDAYSQYIAWGLRESLTAEQIAKLQTLSADQPEIDVPVRVGSTGRLRRTFHMRTNDIVLVILTPYSGARF